MTPLSVRLDDEVRSVYDQLARDRALKTTQLLRSFLTRVAREYERQRKERGEKVISFPAADDDTLPFDFLLAAEPASPREDGK